jgi:hypothetical protein
VIAGDQGFGQATGWCEVDLGGAGIRLKRTQISGAEWHISLRVLGFLELVNMVG